jgi:TRAP-type C4-dicarboxylate transport system permease small subunit
MRVERTRGATAWTWLDRTERAIVAIASILVLPVSLLLFLQWPLREWLQAYSREANDLAQILFAIYVSVAITAASRADAHLAADGATRRLDSRTRRVLARIAASAVLLPWSAFVLYAGLGSLVQSVGQLEGFPETFNPGYFLIRIALALLALLVLLHALRDAFAPTLPPE